MSTDARKRIVDKMAELLEHQGYHATGLNQIIKESEAPRGSLYYYFPEGKEELASEAVLTQGQMIGRNVQEQLACYTDPSEAIVQFAIYLAEHVANTNGCGGAPLAAVTLEAPATSERLRQACQSAYQYLREPFIAHLRPHVASVELAEKLATTIVATLDGAIILCRAEQSNKPLLAVAEVLRLWLRYALEAGNTYNQAGI